MIENGREKKLRNFRKSEEKVKIYSYQVKKTYELTKRR